MLVKGKDIIIVGIQPWDIEIGSNCKNIAIEMAKNNRVLYVNPPTDRISLYRNRKSEKIKKRRQIRQGSPLFEIGENLWTLFPKRTVESINFLPDGQIFDFMNRINARRFAKDILESKKQLGFSEDFILFNDSSMFLGYELKKLLNPSLYVYYIRDNLVNNPYWRKHGKRIEPRLIRDVDLVVTNSFLYTSYAEEFNPHSYMVGQGCDISMFDESKKLIEPASDVSHLKKPVIGYVGHLSSRRLDINLISYLAKERGEYSIVLIGPADDAFKNSGVFNLPNVHYLGSRDVNLLPCYVKSFDVAINPQATNKATMGNYPRKIDEYLALGKPVVVRATPAMDYFRDITYLAATAEDFVLEIDKALEEHTEELAEKRKKVAQSHSWENHVGNIYDYMQKVAQEKFNSWI